MCTKRAQGKGEITKFRDKRAFSENSVSGAPFQLIPGQRGGNRDSPRGTLRYVCALQREKTRFDFKIVTVGFEDFEITLKMFRIGQMLAENSRNHRIRALSAHRKHSWASGGVGEHAFLFRRPLKTMCEGGAPRQRRPLNESPGVFGMVLPQPQKTLAMFSTLLRVSTRVHVPLRCALLVHTSVSGPK